jgi:ribosomal protein S24E
VKLQETSKELIKTLNWREEDVGILSLVGMGGIGKTSLAKEIYRSFDNDETFEKKSILMNVKESAIRDREILNLKKQLAHDLFKEKVESTGEFNECFNRNMDCKVLIVIDDVDQKGQFDQFILDINKLRLGSRIIITSRDSNVVNNIRMNENCKCHMHPMALLSTIDSRHLFNQHAFHSVDPIDDFKKLAEKAADACGGLPLALEVIGCFLFDKKGEDALESIWPQTITALIERKGIFDQLMISYDDLSLEARMMFLDIACFMIGQREDRVMQIFESRKSDYNGPAPCFTSLKDKCLLKLDEDRQIVMHDLLRDMGRQVVKNQSHMMEKGTPSHLWDPEIVQQVLQNKEVST